MQNKLEQLMGYSNIAADTCDIEEIKIFRPYSVTTNPTLMLKAAEKAQYQYLLDEAISWAKQQSDDVEQQVNFSIRKLTINFAKEILQVIKGPVSVEVDPHFSFDVNKTIEEAKRFIQLFECEGISKERVFIKIASTWEGIEAARQLEKEGIHCNMTLIFHAAQAARCANVSATIISPFVGRVYDWYKNKEGREFAADEDPGVLLVKMIYGYYKKRNYSTYVLGASFRTQAQVEAIAGCDYLTISPTLLGQLQVDEGRLERQLQPEQEVGVDFPEGDYDDKAQFEQAINDDEMAREKLSQGISLFMADTTKLKEQLREKLNKSSNVDSAV